MGIHAHELDDRSERLKAPFPWFGGKSRAASLIWDRLGNVDTYNEPFAGSLAVLLSRPHAPRVETVNDLDCYLANFWRALQHDPEQVAYYADYPVNETDMHARHQWLVNQVEFKAAMQADPDHYDAKIAGWWVWGQCLWIGSGWCAKPASEDVEKKRFTGTGNGQGIGVHRRWQGGGAGGGSGVHAPTLTKQLPDSPLRSEGLYDYLHTLAARLRRVRVCCGDWKRVLTPSVSTYVGLCGVLLDPPYSHELRERCYAEDHDISAEVREWAIANGDNPEFRIALCGYADEHPMPSTWECVPWKAHGGYSRSERGVANRERERVWFSPHCIKPELPLFAGAGE